MSWLDDFRSKRMTAADAVSTIRSGDRVYIHEGCGTPQPLIDALLDRSSELRDVELLHMLTFGDARYTDPEYQGRFRHNGIFLGSNVRNAVAAGRADYTPIFLSEIESLFLTGQLPVDVAIIQTSPPDDHGFLSLGTSVDCGLTAALCSKHLIVEVNRQMPRTYGESFIAVSKVHAIVETDRPLLEMPLEPPSDVQRRIAANVASLIPDGAVLQTGIGGIPDAVLSCLRDHKDLGVHSEMCSDGVIELIERGVLTGDRKNIHRGKILIGFVLGTRRLFEFMHDNPIFEMRTDKYTNHTFVIARTERMVALNTATSGD